MTRKEIILIHIRAEGPVTFDECADHVHLQHKACFDYEVAADLTALIKDGMIELGADGTTFSVTAETEAIDACMKAREIVGRRWKDAVHTAWMDGNYRQHGLHDIDSALQRARNRFGPTWLAKLKLPKVEKKRWCDE